MSNLLQDQARIAVASVSQAGRAAVNFALRSTLSRWISGAPSAHHLLIVPQDLRTADPSFATELYDGYFGLAGAVALTGTESPFTIQPPTPAWQRELFAFSWVRNLHAADDEIAREKARGLLADWMALGRSAPSIAWETDIAARRVIALLSHAGFLLDGVDASFYDAFMRKLTDELHHLTIAQGGRNDHSLGKLRALMALLFAGLCIAEQQTYLNAYLSNFKAELEKQLLPDGGHVSRNAACIIEMLLDILPLKQCFIARKMEPPEFLYNAIDRMLPMLRFMRLGDGSLARFNGMGATPLDFLAAVLVYDERPTSLGSHAPQSGYCRLAAGETVILADAGSPPPLLCSAQAHAGCLSFEMSAGGAPLIVNCGAPRTAESDWAVVCRSTAAHSTLTINEQSSARLIKAPAGATHKKDAFLLSGPKSVRLEMTEDANGPVMRAAHNGFRDRFGIIHRRRLKLSPAGDVLEGMDQLAGPQSRTGAPLADASFSIRFHLHPDVAAIAGSEPGTIMLALADESVWQFKAEGASVNIEESIFLADPIGPRRNLQVVLSGPCVYDHQVLWTLRRTNRQAKPLMRASSNAALRADADVLELEGIEEEE